MANINICYGSVEGQTAQIVEYIAELIRAHGHEAEIVDLKHSGDTLAAGQDAVIVAASVHMGKHEKYVVDFVRKNRAELERLPSAFISVSLAAHEDQHDAETFVEEFKEQTSWRPDHVGIFSGALLYTRYNFLKRQMMKKIAKDKGSPDLDTSRDYVYTEWDGVKRFTEDFLAGLAAPSGAAQA